MRQIYGVIATLIAAHASTVEARYYRYYLDPSRAEEILAHVTLKPRLMNSDWLKIIGDFKEDSYEIVHGDNLWNLSRTKFRDPWLWRKVWQVNSFLTNPHQLEVGQLLKFYHESDQTDSAIRVPIVKLKPSGAVSDLDSDEFVSPTIKNKFTVKFLLLNEEKTYGKTTGSYGASRHFSPLEDIYLSLEGVENPKVGQRFAVVRPDRELKDPTNIDAPSLGVLVRVLGEIQITALGQSKAKARVTRHFDAIRRGDLLVDPSANIELNTFERPPENLVARVVMGEVPEQNYFVQGTMVVLNKGIDDGMKAGYLFKVYRDQDPYTKSRLTVESDFKAELQIVHASRLSSIGYIVRNQDVVEAGDAVVPTQAFEDPPEPAPFRSLEPIEIE